jgi:hypothetical protein
MAATNRPRTTSNDDFQFVLDALLKAYKPILEKELKQTESAKALLQSSEKNPPTCDDEIELAEGLFKRFFTPEVASRLLPAEGNQAFGAADEWSWCYKNIICCLIFGWLVCRGPRTYRGFAYYLNRYWRCVREALGQPVSDPLTLDENRDFSTLVRILAKAYAPTLQDQVKVLDYPGDIPGEIESGQINCHTDDDAADSVFERLLSAEGSAALLGAKAYAQQSRSPIYRSCRCYCVCALDFGCCLGRSRTLVEALRCLEGFFDCVRRCFEPLIAEIDTPPACSSLTFVPACGDLVGIEVNGTAAGGAFTSYALSYSLGGPPVNDAVVYPDCSRPPLHASSTTPVSGGVLGYLDFDLLPAGTTQATVYLDVYGSGALHLQVSAVFQFAIDAIEITAVANVPTFIGQDPFTTTPSSIKMLQNAASPGLERSIGGSVGVTGSAYVNGCGSQMTQYQLALFGPVPGAEPLPAPTPSPTALGGIPLIPPVPYDGTSLHPWSSGCGIGPQTLNVILNGNLVAKWISQPCPIPFPSVPKISTTDTWASAPNGRSVIFLEVDEGPTASPHTPFVPAGQDQVAVWIDNFNVVGLITQVGSVIGCGDLHLKDYVGTTAPVKGIAWDYPIDLLSPQKTPNDNFGAYALSYQKNGGSGQNFLNSDYTPNGAVPGTSPTVRVPNLWQSTPPVASGLLASWDIVTALDGGAPPDPNQPCVPTNPWQLPRGCRCAYVIELTVNDTTWVGNGGDNHETLALFAINIINDIGT